MLGLLKSRKVDFAIVGLVLGTLAHAFPAWPLPPVDLVVDLVLGLIATHTLTDVVALVSVAVKEYLLTRQESPR
jgi:hypothetical protein